MESQEALKELNSPPIKTHTHHVIPKSRGGSDDEWNLRELDSYSHTYEHALDFLLFDHAPHFDFRLEAWPLLPQDLKEAVLKRHSEWMSENNPMYKDGAKEKISLRMSGEGNPQFGKSGTLLGVKGEDHPSYGRVVSEETRQKTSGENHHGYGKPRSEETKQKISKKLVGKGWSSARRQSYENKWGSLLENKQDIVDLYNRGMSTTHLSLLFSSTHKLIATYLKEWGVQLRPRSSNKEQRELSKNLYKEQCTLRN